MELQKGVVQSKFIKATTTRQPTCSSSTNASATPCSRASARSTSSTYTNVQSVSVCSTLPHPPHPNPTPKPSSLYTTCTFPLPPDAVQRACQKSAASDLSRTIPTYQDGNFQSTTHMSLLAQSSPHHGTHSFINSRLSSLAHQYFNNAVPTRSSFALAASSSQPAHAMALTVALRSRGPAGHACQSSSYRHGLKTQAPEPPSHQVS